MKKEHAPIPEHFKSIEAAAEFWDSHDLGDYWDLTREAHFDVDIQSKTFLAALEDMTLACAISDGESSAITGRAEVFKILTTN